MKKKMFFSSGILSGLISIPLKMGNTDLSECIVKVGDKVLTNELLGQSKTDTQLNIYSSVCGKVVAIDKMLNSRNGLTTSVLIQPDEKQLFAPPMALIAGKDRFLSNLQTLGIFNYDFTTIASNYSQKDLDSLKSLGILIFDEYATLSNQYDTMLENAGKVLETTRYVADILGVSDIKIFLPKNNKENEELKNNILKNAKNKEKITFYEIKISKNVNFYDFFKKYLTKNLIDNCFIQTPEIYLDIFEGLKNGAPKTRRNIYIGGSATQNNDGFLETKNGTSLKQIVDMCGGLVCDEQEIEDRKNDLYDDIEKMQELKAQYKGEKGQKRAELKRQYLAQKKYTNSLVWNFIKSERQNLLKTIRQIRVGSKKMGQIFTDFSPILDLSDNAIFFLNRKEV